MDGAKDVSEGVGTVGIHGAIKSGLDPLKFERAEINKQSYFKRFPVEKEGEECAGEWTKETFGKFVLAYKDAGPDGRNAVFADSDEELDDRWKDWKPNEPDGKCMSEEEVNTYLNRLLKKKSKK